MANHLSVAYKENEILSQGQAGFQKGKKAVAQLIALAEIVCYHFLEGKLTFGIFVDFKKAYNKVYHGLLF
jgi:hypothetical protein